MRDQVRTSFWIETALAVLSGLLLVLTLAWRDWIEKVFGADPDHHSGSLEWSIVAALFVSTAVFAVLARAAWRQPAVPSN